MHGQGFLIDADVNASGQVNSPAMLSIGINDGMQVNNLNTMGANRLLVFTGVVVNPIWIGTDDNLTSGVFRIRLRFPLPPNVIFKASATIAALAGLHGESDEDLTFGTDAAVTVIDPTDGNTLAQPSQPLPSNELYAIIDATYQGEGSHLSYVSYQANILVQDLNPDLDSLLLSPAGLGMWSPQLNITAPEVDYLFDIKVVTTGPVPGPDTPGSFFGVVVESDNNVYAPVGQLVVVPATYSSGEALGYRVITGTPGNTVVKITGTYTSATGRQTIKTATIQILPVPH